MKMKHFLQFNDLNKAELESIFDRAKWIKAKFKASK